MENSNQEIIRCNDTTIIEIIAGRQFIDSDKLRWRVDEGGQYLTLDSIYWQLVRKGYGGVFIVWLEKPLEGVIYQCNNHGMGDWYQHGTTNGYT